MIYKHISDIRHVTSVNNGENYVNLISTSAYRRRATTGTSKEDGADRWSLWAKLSARTHMCVGVCVCVCGNSVSRVLYGSCKFSRMQCYVPYEWKFTLSNKYAKRQHKKTKTVIRSLQKYDKESNVYAKSLITKVKTWRNAAVRWIKGLFIK